MTEIENRLDRIEKQLDEIAEQLNSLYSLFVALNEKVIDSL